MKPTAARFKPWRVVFLPHQPPPHDNEHHYEHFRNVEGFVATTLKEWKAWCLRFNSAGTEVLDDMERSVRETEGWFMQNPYESERLIEGLLDEHTSTTIRIRIRKVKP